MSLHSVRPLITSSLSSEHRAGALRCVLVFAGTILSADSLHASTHFAHFSLHSLTLFSFSTLLSARLCPFLHSSSARFCLILCPKHFPLSCSTLSSLTACSTHNLTVPLTLFTVPLTLFTVPLTLFTVPLTLFTVPLTIFTVPLTLPLTSCSTHHCSTLFNFVTVVTRQSQKAHPWRPKIFKNGGKSLRFCSSLTR
jgi:hypothetical protein